MSRQASPRSQSMYASRDDGAAIQSSIEGLRCAGITKEGLTKFNSMSFRAQQNGEFTSVLRSRGTCFWARSVLRRFRPRLGRRPLRRPQHQILPARPGQKSRQQSGNAIEQDLFLGTESIFAVAFHVQEAKLASAHPHGDYNFLARSLHCNLVGLDESFLQQRRRRFFVQRQINSHPTKVPAFAQQPGNLFQRRAPKRSPILRQHFLDVGKQVARGAVSSQGAPEGNWRSQSSLMRAGIGVKGGEGSWLQTTLGFRVGHVPELLCVPTDP